jgi:hypothetical protein
MSILASIVITDKRNISKDIAVSEKVVLFVERPAAVNYPIPSVWNTFKWNRHKRFSK